MSFEADVRHVFKSLIGEHSGDYRMALWDLSHRYVVANKGTTWAMLRRMHPATEGKIDDVPNPIDDDWIRTALGDA